MKPRPLLKHSVCGFQRVQAPGQNQAQDKANLAKSKRTKKMKSTKVVKIAGRVKDAGLSHIKHAQ